MSRRIAVLQTQRWRRVLVLLLVLLLGVCSPAYAASSVPANAIDPSELEAFLDPLFAKQMAIDHIPGAVFTLVQNGKIIFSKGYGYANLEQKIPVDPEQTVFRVGSVSKLFTATAVMQLVEHGQVKLTDDVNQYLQSFRLQANFPQPVAIANLLTQTSGLDEKFIGVAARRADQVTSLGKYLSTHLPPRFLPPGEILRYSNHAFVLAGYLVEQITGVPFADYAERNILQPLEMHHSSFVLQPSLLSTMATGYRYRQHHYQPLPVLYTNDMPSGALSATATDMAQFMIAHLQNGRYNSQQILQEATAQTMHRQQFTHHPRLPGQAYGFYERFQNGLHAIEHDGQIGGFKSRLFLLPEQNLGFFASYNSDRGALQDELVQQFLDHYYPATPQAGQSPVSKASPLPSPPDDFQMRAHFFTGSYRHIRYPRSTLEKLSILLPCAPLLASELHVTTPGDGTLSLQGDRMVEVEPLLFQKRDGSFVAFRENVRGQITHLFIGKNAYERLHWYESSAAQLGLLTACILVFGIKVLGELGRAVLLGVRQRLPLRGAAKLSRLRTISTQKTTRLTRWMRCLVNAICGLNLVFCIGLLTALVGMDLAEFVYGVPVIIVALLCLPLLAANLTIWLPICLVLGWRDRTLSWGERSCYLLVTGAAVGFICFLNYWNLLGFRF